MRRLIQSLCLATVLGGLNAPVVAIAAEDPAGTRRVVFSCPRDQQLIVAFLTAGTGEQAVVEPPTGAAVTLPIQLSGSGYRYADDTHELRGKGREVIWTDASKRPIVCTAPN